RVIVQHGVTSATTVVAARVQLPAKGRKSISVSGAANAYPRRTIPHHIRVHTTTKLAANIEIAVQRGQRVDGSPRAARANRSPSCAVPLSDVLSRSIERAAGIKHTAEDLQ